MKSFAANATVVLVHGAWADGSSWQNVIPLLRQEGLAVVCAPIPMTSLSDDIAAVERVVERTTGPIVLSGHSYGGAPISGIRDTRVKCLVYVAALAPEDGEAVADVFYRAKPHPEAPKLEPDAHGFVWMSEEGFARAVAPNASAGQRTILFATQRPIGVKCIQEKAPATVWKSKRSWYLVAEEDRMISPDTQRFMAERMCARIHSHAVDHFLIQTAPDLVADVLMEAANQTLAS
jgi:pimeloyl-ACP methyl ester carboxylesterase